MKYAIYKEDDDVGAWPTETGTVADAREDLQYTFDSSLIFDVIDVSLDENHQKIIDALLRLDDLHPSDAAVWAALAKLVGKAYEAGAKKAAFLSALKAIE